MARRPGLRGRGALRTGPLMAGLVPSAMTIRIPAMRRAPMMCSVAEPSCIAIRVFAAGSAVSIVSFSLSRIPSPVSSISGLTINRMRVAAPSIGVFGSWRMTRNQKSAKCFQRAHSSARSSAFELLTLSNVTTEENILKPSVTQQSKSFLLASGRSIPVFNLPISLSDNHRISKSTYQGRHAISA